MRHVRIRVTGTVQGVFFRVSTRDAATRLGIVGSVRNEPDGSVFIDAQGDEKSVAKFVEWCRQGPPRASVTRVHVEDVPLQTFSGFEVTG
jgi:acylphosphatase